MAKFIQIVLFIACAAICCAEPARLRNRQSKFSARQEVAEDVPAQTPYPPAGIVPEVRFNLPTEDVAVEPDNTYLPPDNAPTGIPAKTYGPPEAEDPSETAEPEAVEPKSATDDDAVTEEPEDEEAETEQPENVDQSEEKDPIDDEAEDNEIETDPIDEEELLLVVPLTPRTKTARLQTRPLTPLRSQRVTALPIPYRSQRLIGQQLYFADGRFFAYTPQYV